jgi:hypothetical protein
MSNMRVSGATYTDMTNQVTNFSVRAKELDTPGDDYTPDLSKWYGYYSTIPELQAVIDKMALWILGKGYEADERDTAILSKLRGNGKDTFNTILYNVVRSSRICGDGFAEIIKNKRGELKNLKPISSGSMTIKSNKSGQITKYVQTAQNGKDISFEPDEIFHIIHNRTGDECHGHSVIEKIENIILMKNEAMSDLKVVFHRYVKPLIISEIDSDDPTTVEAFKAKLDKAVALGENMVIPKGTVAMQRVSIPQFSSLDPLPWIRLLNDYIIMAEGIPAVVLGEGKETTEASSKILYLAFQQTIEWNQLYLEEQIKAQLKIDVELNFPVSIEPAMAQDIQKAGQIGQMDMKEAANNVGAGTKEKRGTGLGTKAGAS